MHDILILYNPYYQHDVIKQHLKILSTRGQVAFGKIKSKNRDMLNKSNEALQKLFDEVSETNPLQLFLTDYANLFVAKVIKVCKNITTDILPSYYKDKQLEVEHYYIIDDLREIARENFSQIREYLANFTTPHYKDGGTYAIYGNDYVYPLMIEQKNYINYFYEDDLIPKHYLNIYKTQEYLEAQNALATYVFGYKFFMLLHPDSINNLVSAEIEYRANIQNPLYDFTSVIVKYSKVLEYEFYDFTRAIIRNLWKTNPKILDALSISIGKKTYPLKAFLRFERIPSLHDIKLLLTNIGSSLSQSDKDLIKIINTNIQYLQNIRNPALHDNNNKPASIKEAQEFRDKILGIESISIIKSFLCYKHNQSNFYQK